MESNNWLSRNVRKLKGLAGSVYYASFIGFLAFLDSYIVVIPIELLLVTASLGRRKAWLSVAFQIALGSALGGALLVYFTGAYGRSWVDQIFPNLFHSHLWLESQGFIESQNVFLGIFLISLSPLPQQPALVFAGLSSTPPSPLLVFLAVLVARGIKYAFIARGSLTAQKFIIKSR